MARFSGPATDFRGDLFPKTGPVWPRPQARIGWHRACLIPDRSEKAMAKISPFKFLQEVRAETEKVTWPTRRETAITTIMVFVMVAIASVFFLVADQVIRVFVTFVLGLGS
jgi:preprotein translocase subunit SecE